VPTVAVKVWLAIAEAEIVAATKAQPAARAKIELFISLSP